MFIRLFIWCSGACLFSSFDADDLSIDDISLKWSSAPGTANSHGQPFVADLDNDGSPEVIVTNEQNSTLNILDGIGNGTGFSDYDGITGGAALDLGFKPYNTVAIGDLDGIGPDYPSIVIAGYTGTLASPDHKISLWSYDGTNMVQSWIIDLEEVTGSLDPTLATNAAPGTIGIADFGGGAKIYLQM